jgi:hypothetical protein
MSIYECQCNCAECPMLCECPCGEDWETCPVNELVGKLEAIEDIVYRGGRMDDIENVLEGKRTEAVE